MNLSSRRRLLELRRGLERHEIIAVFQPIFDITDGHVVGVEALARWQHPTEGMISPQVFVPLAVEGGLIDVLLDRILTEVARVVPELGPDRYVAVNVSASQLGPSGTAERILDRIRSMGLRYGDVVIEVTESETLQLQDRGVAGEVLQLREAGVQFAVDDFGVGYSNLRNVALLSPDIIKIDGSLIRGLPESPWDSIVDTICRLAEWMDATVIAEGVETEQQLDALRRRRVDAAQGYHLARPAAQVDSSSSRLDAFTPAPADSRPLRVGLVDDDERLLDIINDVLTEDGFDVAIVESTSDGFLRALRREAVDVAIVDLVLAGLEDGMRSVVRPLRLMRPELAVIVFSSLYDETLRSESDRLRCWWVEKASGIDALVETLGRISAGRRTARQL